MRRTDSSTIEYVTNTPGIQDLSIVPTALRRTDTNTIDPRLIQYSTEQDDLDITPPTSPLTPSGITVNLNRLRIKQTEQAIAQARKNEYDGYAKK